jgi:CheY-like chemotaxis protein
MRRNIGMTCEMECFGTGLPEARADAGSIGRIDNMQSDSTSGNAFSQSSPNDSSPALPRSAEHTLLSEAAVSIRPLTILIAEDDPDSYKLYEIILAGCGATLLHTINGEDTVKAVMENPDIALVLMDIKMPGMDGLTATRLIREQGNSVPIISQTAHAFVGDKEKALLAGCNDYVAKPINRATLLALIKKYIGSSLNE